MSVAVVAMAVVVYFATRPAQPLLQTAAPPTWGTVTLAHIALGEAKKAGDAHPVDASWMFTHNDRVVPVLSPGSPSTAEAEYVVSMEGSFHSPSVQGALPGSLASGSRLVLLVRAFDGSVAGWMLTSHLPPGLAALSIVHPLKLGEL